MAVLWLLLGLAWRVPLLARPQVQTFYIAVGSLSSAMLNFLAFYPPKAYLRLIERGHQIRASA